MKSIVDKLSSRLEKVENSGGSTSGLSKDEVTQLIKDTDPKDHEHEIDDIKGLDTTKFATKEELNSHEHKSSDISDRISEYLKWPTSSSLEWKLPEESLFSPYSGAFGKGIALSFTSTFSFTIVYDSQEYQINQSTSSGLISKELNLSTWSTYIAIFPVSEEITQSINMVIKDIIIDESSPKTENITIEYIPGDPKTTMNEDQVMTANAVRGYVEECNFSQKVHSHNIYDINDVIYEFTTDNLYFHVEPPFKLEGNEITFDSQYLTGQDINLTIYIHVNQNSYMISIGNGSISNNSNFNYEQYVKFEFRDNSWFISLPETANRVKLTMNCNSLSIFTQEFSEVKLVISRGPTDMSSDKLMTTNAVREYVEAILKEKVVIQ